MHDDLRRKLDQRLNRRGFLRGSALAVAGAAALPLRAFAQQTAPPQDGKKDEAPKGKAPETKDDKKESKPAEKDEFKITRKDENGRDYRLCPQCGYNMYKQDRTWTCENCGYSYTE